MTLWDLNQWFLLNACLENKREYANGQEEINFDKYGNFFTIFTCSLCESRNQEKRIKDLNVIRKGKRVFMLIDIRISLMLVRHRYN